MICQIRRTIRFYGWRKSNLHKMFLDFIIEKVLNSGIFYYWRPNRPSEKIDGYRSRLFENIIRQSAFFKLSDLSEIQNNLLRKILKKSIKTSFWRRHTAPFLTKKEILRHKLSDFFPSYLDKNWAWLISTSGTTGEKVNFLQDKFASAISEAFFKRALSWASLQNRNRILILNFSRSWNQNSGVHINLYEDEFKNIGFILNQHDPEGLFADVDLLIDLSNELDGQNESFKVKSVVYNGRLLVKYEKELIKKVFHCELFSLYGASECGIIASECAAHNGLHINMERVYVEIVNNSIIITVFDNEVMPLIRYKIGDLGRIENSPCSCGINLPRLFLEGREKHDN